MSNTDKQNVGTTDYTTEQKIIFLYELQQVQSNINEINFIKGALPSEVSDLEDEVEGLKTRLVNIVNKVDELTKSSKAAKENIENAKALIKKYGEQQQNVRNNREYESISKEIEYQQLEIELAEKQIKDYSAESKEKKVPVETVKVTLADKEFSLNEKRSELEMIDSETVAEIKALQLQSDAISVKIDERLLIAFNKIRKSMKNGVAVATVRRNACSGCFNRIPPQRQLDIRLSKKIIVCEYCGRILVSDLLNEQNDENI